MGKEMVTSESFLGWALDGFEIWGPLSDEELEILKLAGKMDDCNGVLSDDGSYRYHVRTNDQVDGDGEYCNGDSPVINWNYILGCYSGDITETNVYNADAREVPEGCVEEDGTTDAPVEEPTEAPIKVGGPTTSKKRPNIIIMQPDDLVFIDKWTPPPNNPSSPNSKNRIPDAGMPNIELLRTSGLQMMQAYAASAVCGTSRFSTITGKMPSRANSVRGKNEAQPSKVTIPTTKLEGGDCSSENLAQAFREEDYATGMVGKWHLSNINNDQYTYESSVDTVKGCGFDFVGGLYIENLAEDESEYSLYSDGTFSHNMEWITYEAINFIEEQAGSDTPFFLYFNPTVPHGSNDVKKALEDFSCQDTADQDFNWPGDEDPFIPGMVEEGCEKYRETVIQRSKGIDGDLGKIWLDDSVGALLRALEDNGIYEDTIFLFQEDHMMDAKGTLFENGIRIPQFIHYPAGIEAGTKFDAPVSTVDIAATMLDYAGIEAPYKMDGKSWKNVIGNTDRESYWKNDRCLFFDVDKDRAVRCGCFKWLVIDNELSTTYTRGGDKGHLVNLGGMLFDLCDGGEEYIVENDNNREASEVTNQFLENTLKNNLQCYLDNTDPKGDAVFDVCGQAPPETLKPETGGPTESPTESPIKSPTAAPEPTCKDSGLIAIVGNRSGSCADIKEGNYCENNFIWGHCRESCNKCNKCRDSKAQFMITIPGTNNTIKKDCKFVRKNDGLCDDEDIFHACGKACGACS
jgi:arylsulfatase A-like enzyme